MTFGILMLTACRHQEPSSVTQRLQAQESREAKRLLQGIWIESETEEEAFRAIGDTIFFTDPSSQPAYFCIVDDSLFIGNNHYPIIKQGEHLFWFQNQGGDVVKLIKSDEEDDTLAFVRPQPEMLTVTEVVKTDSVVCYGGERYHWYIAVNPTRYRVTKTNYNSEGVAVENVYFDNIIHLSQFQHATSNLICGVVLDIFIARQSEGHTDGAEVG